MALWKKKALELIRESGHNPDLGEFEKIRSADGPMMLWIELFGRFVQAHHKPMDIAFIQKVYEYARWCVGPAPRGADAGTDPSTAAVVAFYEDLPIEPAVRLHLHEFMPQEEFESLADTFRYHLSDEEFKQFRDEMLLRYRKMSITPPRRRNR